MRHRRYAAMIVFLAVVVLLWPVGVTADEEHAHHGESDEETHHHEDTGHADEGGDHHEGHHDYKNALALFLGATSASGHGTDQTIGLDYAHMLSKNWAVGGLIDYAGPDQRNWIAAPAVYWKPGLGNLTLLAAAGVEFHDGRGEVEHHLLKSSDPEVDEDSTEFLFRLGAVYMFHVGSRYGIGPNVNLDLVNGHEVWVYGVAFEVMF